MTSTVLRIIVAKGLGETVLKLEGRLTGDEVGELSRVCREARGTLVLDLSNLLFADRVGIRQIQAVADDGAELVGVSRYVGILLKTSLRTKRPRGGPEGSGGPPRPPEL